MADVAGGGVAEEVQNDALLDGVDVFVTSKVDAGVRLRLLAKSRAPMTISRMGPIS